MIMQSYDFYHMFQKYGCNMQFGGDDQLPGSRVCTMPGLALPALGLAAAVPTALSAKKIAEKLGLGSRSIEKNIKKLKTLGFLIRHGSPKNGYWEVTDCDTEEKNK